MLTDTKIKRTVQSVGQRYRELYNNCFRHLNDFSKFCSSQFMKLQKCTFISLYDSVVFNIKVRRLKN